MRSATSGAARWAALLASLSTAIGAVAAEPRLSDLNAPLAEAQRALAKGDYEAAWRLNLSQDARGNGLAAFNLGLMSRQGWGRPADPAAACQWFGRAADAGLPAARHFFGDCLKSGVGGAARPAEAAVWYRRAIEQGYAGALCPLGELIFDGKGVDASPAQGIALCRQAAELGSPLAAAQLAELLLRLDPPDHVGAIEWLTRAARSGDPVVKLRLGELLSRAGPDPDALAAAAWWIESAAAAGYRPAYLPLARLYFGDGHAADGGRLPAERLAKSYLWAAALLRRSPDEPAGREARALLTRILAVMPGSWQPELDRRIKEHLIHTRAPATTGS